MVPKQSKSNRIRVTEILCENKINSIRTYIRPFLSLSHVSLCLVKLFHNLQQTQPKSFRKLTSANCMIHVVLPNTIFRYPLHTASVITTRPQSVSKLHPIQTLTSTNEIVFSIIHHATLFLQTPKPQRHQF